MIEEHDYSPYQLPTSWVWTRLGEIAEINPRLPMKEISGDLDVSFLPMKAVEERTGRFDLSLTRKFCEVRKGFTPFVDGDIIFAKITPCMENGKVAIVGNLKNGIGFGSTEFHVIRLIERDCSREYFLHYLLQEDFRKRAGRNMKGTAGQLRVPPRFMEEALIPLAPASEQHRIVAKVDELFTDLDAGVGSLEKVKAQLKHYRQAVLKYAFEGKLTEEWRETHKDRIKPAQELLNRVKQEYAEHRKGKHDELPPIGIFDLPELPGSWIWTRVDWLCDVQTGPFGTQLHRSDYADSGVPTIEIGDVHPRRNLKEGTTHFIPKQKAHELERFEVRGGDVLFSRVGTVGRCTIVPADCEGWIMSTSLIRVRPTSSDLLPSYLLFYFWSPTAQAFTRKTSKGTTRAGTNSRIVGELPLIVPPLTEQYVIVERIEQQLSVADKIEESVEQNLRRTETLRRTILRKAFEGRLVPQDASDEPAEELLERIKKKMASRETATGPKMKNEEKDMGLMDYVK